MIMEQFGEFTRLSQVILKVLEAGGVIGRRELCDRLIFESRVFQEPNDVRDAFKETGCLWRVKGTKDIQYERDSEF